VLKQQLPEQQFSILNIGTIRGKHIPLLTVVIGAIHGVIVGQVTDFLYLIIGVYVAWFYLRFFQLHDDGAKGDMAESFSFSSFFPNAIQYVLFAIL
jgi:large-conductance mechanosensitive channel